MLKFGKKVYLMWANKHFKGIRLDMYCSVISRWPYFMIQFLMHYILMWKYWIQIKWQLLVICLLNSVFNFLLRNQNYFILLSKFKNDCYILNHLMVRYLSIYSLVLKISKILISSKVATWCVCSYVYYIKYWIMNTYVLKLVDFRLFYFFRKNSHLRLIWLEIYLKSAKPLKCI